jgi:hypothetical protein
VSVLHGDHYRLPLPQSQHRGCGSQGAHTQGVSESNPKGIIVSIKSKVFAAAAALTLAGSLGASGALTASAATPSCGPDCINVFSKNFGTYHSPQFVLDVQGQNSSIGGKIILFRQSNSDPAEDFTVTYEGLVSDFFAAGLVSASLNLHYGNGSPSAGFDHAAFEEEYSPYGVLSGLCVGVASTAVANEKVTLQPCGVTSKTVWVVDFLDSCPFGTNPLYFGEAPVINGSDTNFSHPFVLTYPAAGYPTDSPRPQLFVTNLNGFSQSGNGIPCGGGSVVGPNSNQLWGAKAGVLP